jgi:hypothetical protein
MSCSHQYLDGQDINIATVSHACMFLATPRASMGAQRLKGMVKFSRRTFLKKNLFLEKSSFLKSNHIFEDGLWRCAYGRNLMQIRES